MGDISIKGHGIERRNTRRENRLEELGRVDAERGYSRKGKRNLKEEKKELFVSYVLTEVVSALKMVNGFRKLTSPLKKEELKVNVLRLQNQDVQVELKH